MLDTFLILAATAAPDGADGNFLTMLTDDFGVDLKILVVQMINFGLVAWALWQFAFKPVIATMDERQKRISDGLQFAEEAKQQLASAEKEKAEKLREANGEAQRIVAEAKTRADALAAETTIAAERAIEDKRRRADEGIERERQKVLGEARHEIARLVVLTSSKVLGQELSADDKNRYNTAAAKEVAALN